MQPGSTPPQQSLLGWIVGALGYHYAILLPLSALVSFVLTLILVTRGKGPMAGFALLLIIPVPLLVGMWTAIEHGILAIRAINLIDSDPRPGHFAAIALKSLVGPLVGMAFMAPSYVLAIIGCLSRSFPAEPKVSNVGRE
jgi:hypothetical protein